MKTKIARFLFKFHGWSLVGKPIPPEASRCMFIYAPHTSNWDFYYGMLCMMGWGIPVKVAIKDFWTKFPFSLIIKPLGGVGINRSKRQKGTSQIYDLVPIFEQNERIAFIITPEGSRGPRTQWKAGFYQIARLAKVPMVTLKGNFADKTVEFGPVFYPDQELDTIMRSMMEFFKDGVGKYPEMFKIDERYI